MAPSEQQSGLVVFDFNGTIENNGSLYDGVVESIETLHNSGFTMAIATQASAIEVRRVLDRYKLSDGTPLADVMTPIIGQEYMAEVLENGQRDKSCPLILNRLLRETGYRRCDVLVIGDTFQDLALAEKSRTSFLYASWEDPHGEQLHYVAKKGCIEGVTAESVQEALETKIKHPHEIATAVQQHFRALDKTPPSSGLGPEPGFSR